MKQLLLMAGLVLTSSVFAQKAVPAAPEVKYRRSSLHMVLCESEKFPQKEVVMKAYNTAPFPDKYNDHTIVSEKSFDPAKYALTDAEKVVPTTGAGKLGKMAKGAAGDATGGAVDADRATFPLVIAKYLKNKKVANQMVAKWFDRQADGTFDMNLIGERGSYSATDLEANVAKGSARGLSSLSDAGEELIKNSFVVFTKLNFVANEPVAAALRDAAKIAAAAKIKIPAALDAANKAADLAYEKAKEGYSVWTTAYLYKLKWNDSISAVFYNDLWANKGKADAKRKEAFDKSDMFQMEFVGDEKAVSLVTFSLKEKRTEEQIISLATVRNLDAVFAKLQKKYEVFKPKIPLANGDPITAKIGMKEGLEGGEKFEVLEQQMDPKTGLTSYKSKGKITVMKDMLWDNRYNAGEAPVPQTLAAGEVAKPVLDRTTFKGGKKFYTGMLIRQMK